MATISLCMIVKNEEAVLARCLKSIYDAVDEIVIVDTGSTDATKKIAAKYTDLIFDFKWIDNFSAARNFAFSKATKEYIMWLDADDVILKKNYDDFVKLKRSISADTDVIMLPYHTAFDEEDNPVFSYYRERIIKRNIPHSWQGRVHEVIMHSGKISYGSVPVTHRSIKTSYSNRNLYIYEKQEEDGEPFSARDKFYYGRELYYHKHYDKAVKILKNFLEGRQGWIEDNIEACKILSYTYYEQNDIENAANALAKSFVYDIPRAEICCELGNLFFKQKDYKTAVFWYELALNLPKRNDYSGFVSKDCSGYLPAIQLCVCYDKMGEYKKAEEYNNLAGKHRPMATAYLQNLKYFKNIFSHPSDCQ